MPYCQYPDGTVLPIDTGPCPYELDHGGDGVLLQENPALSSTGLFVVIGLIVLLLALPQR